MGQPFHTNASGHHVPGQAPRIGCLATTSSEKQVPRQWGWEDPIPQRVDAPCKAEGSGEMGVRQTPDHPRLPPFIGVTGSFTPIPYLCISCLFIEWFKMSVSSGLGLELVTSALG